MQFPVGTITFLFTDIEGSTKLWENYPVKMRVALSRHETLLREAITSAGGTIFKTVGDGMYVAFASPSDAFAATVEAQRAIQREPWPSTTPIRVRMALHTGVAEFRDGDYFGTVLNRVARLLATGHGGQILVSAATYELVQDHLDHLPQGIGLRDLGSHRLKDLNRPEHVFQIVHPALPANFPPLRSVDNLDAAIHFSDHIRVDTLSVETSLAARDARRVTMLPIAWHPKIQETVLLVERVRSDSDTLLRHLFTRAHDHNNEATIAQSVTLAKTGFALRYEKLETTLRDAEQNVALLDSRLAGLSLETRVAATASYCSFAALKVVRYLQQFTGLFVDLDNHVIAQVFNDLPLLDSQLLACLPYRSTAGYIAFGEPSFLRATVGAHPHLAYEMMVPSHLAGVYEQGQTLPESLYYRWILPQWIVRLGTVPPERDACHIFTVTDQDRAAPRYDPPTRDDRVQGITIAEQLAQGTQGVLQPSGYRTVIVPSRPKTSTTKILEPGK